MRLIDADKFKQEIAAITINENPAFPFIVKENNLCNLIDAQPIAYDVDKVVEQLRAAEYNHADYGHDYAIDTEKAVDIVETRGID